ncbi:MAG: prolipoprotein diacylglyceryl transferase [Bdellovibrionaceae bacterium]|nr:prolipoprotein diacylglyceryl transferase [Pseudobdellovibrionaceae bacterium]
MAEYIHNLDPFAIQISGSFGIRWYGLAYILGFFSCYFIVYKLAQRGKSLVSIEQASDFIAYMAFGTMIGGRLGYCVFYDPELLISFSPVKIPLLNISIPMWEALAVWNGGMASHGGIIGIAVACILFGRSRKIPFLHLFDLTVLAGSLAVGFGRIANFINGELYGRACDGKCFWPVKFPDELRRWVSNWDSYKEQLKGLYPVVEKMGGIAGPEGQLISPSSTKWMDWINNGSRYYVETYVGRILRAVSDGNQEILTALGSALIPRHPSQLYQSLMEGFLVFFILLFIWRKPQKPGVLVSYWGVIYAVMRITGEQFRMPDAHIGFQLFGLTRGQWLSLVMLLVFVGLLIWTSRRPVPKMGGWGKD